MVAGDDDRFAQILGGALISVWSELPPEIQQQVFERAILLGHHGEPDENLREQLAHYLHEHHKRTAGH